jgi:regulation of enolase protein 1 (concanavalin A-like superfamily)
VRATASDEPWRLVRLAPIDPTLTWSAGPLAASPTRSGLRVTFHAWEASDADTALH